MATDVYGAESLLFWLYQSDKSDKNIAHEGDKANTY